MYKYWGFGLKIASYIEFPELLKADFDIPDVEFVAGKVPAEINGEAFSFRWFSYHINRRELLFTSNEVAKYYAFDGSKVIIEPFVPVTDKRAVRLYLLATVMAGILLQRNRLPLHASAVRQNNGLILITGDSHAGKSTSLAGLLKKGYTVFSDDVVVLQEEQGMTYAKASYPMIKLWDDTLTKMGHPMFEDRSFRIQKDIDKYGLFFHDRFDMNSYSIDKVFVLKVDNNRESLISRKIAGGEAFHTLLRQIYRPMLISGTEQKLLSFKLVTDVVKSGNVIEITRPADCDTNKLVDFVESLL
nr:hypothetical protein [uncultured Draconibacterium sp.]